MGIQEVYEKFKHLDTVLSDERWMCENHNGHIYATCYELWLAIKNELMAEDMQKKLL